MHVNQLGKSLGTTPDTVRYYTRIGLLRPTRNPDNAYKCYGEDDSKRLRFILCARQMGFSVNEIADILTESERGRTACPQVAELLQKRLAQTQPQLTQTLSLSSALHKAVQQWQSEPQHAPTGDMLSKLITEFAKV